MAPNTASASRGPRTCAMPQSSRVMVTRPAWARQRASSAVGAGGAAAVRRKRRRAGSPKRFQKVMTTSPRRGQSDQEDVTGMDDADRAVGEAQAQRAGLVQPVEHALRAPAGERGAERMGGREPGGADRGQALDLPALEPVFEA